MSAVPAVSPEARTRFSIENRVVTAALVTAIVVLAAAAGAFFLQQWRGEIVALGREQRLAARTAVAVAGVPRTPQAASALLAHLEGTSGLAAARVEGAGRRPLAARAFTAPPAHPTQEIVSLPDGGRIVLVGGDPRVARLLPETLSVCAALFFMATGLALFLGRALARKVVAPLDGLSSFMNEVAGRGDVARRAPPSSVAEVARLTASFNNLLDRLQANDAALQGSMAELVQARDDARAASLMKSQFLANMSHEIRTPLNGVLAMTEVMALDGLDPVQRERLRVVRESGEALLAVLNDVLDVSKIEAGRLELEAHDFDLAAMVASACNAFTAALRDKGLAFRVEIAPGAQGWRRGDEARLRQVLVNLLSNAVKFTDAGEVSVTVSATADGAGIVVEVADTGLGLEPDQVSRVFDRFTQADTSTTRRFGGAGLGLTICSDLVDLMGGEISVESEPGRGSRFRVAVPLERIAASAAEPVTAAPPVASATPRALHVLAAEDNATNQQVLATIMDVFGVELQIVPDGRQAVEAWRRGGFDLILMDVQMPEMDGLEATRAIRAAEREAGLPRTPIIALSANAMTHQVRDYLAAGMDDHVPKPIELARLQAAMFGARAEAA